MRLTLRTLLAYLDDVLDPSDASDLEAKIRESDFASGLVHRIRGAAGRLRLSSPPPLGRGLVADANSVAEYLDNTMEQERVADFERICLESDMHLAEVASCHQILTLVLGEPAVVEPATRRRIYQLDKRGATAEMENGVHRRIDEALRESSSNQVTNPTTGHGRGTSADYLRPRRKSFAPWIVMGLLAGLVACGFLLRTPDKTRQLTETGTAEELPIRDGLAGVPADENGRLSPPAAIVASDSAAAAAPMAAPEMTGGRGPGISDLAADPTLDDSSPSDEFSAVNSHRETGDFVPGGPPPSQATAPDLAAESNSTLADNDSFPAAGTGDTNPPHDGSDASMSDPVVSAPNIAPPPPLLPTVEEPSPDPSAVAAANVSPPFGGDPAIPLEFRRGSMAEATDGVTSPPLDPNDGVVPGNKAAINEAAMTNDASVDGVTADDATNDEIGSFLSESELLAYWNRSSGMWMRVPARAKLIDGVHLRGLPVYRPKLVVGEVQVALQDNAELMIERDVNSGIPVLNVGFGRLIVSALAGDAGSVELAIQGRRITVALAGNAADVGIEVRREMLPGNDPATAVRSTKVRVMPTAGRIGVRDGVDYVAVEANQVWQCENDQPGKVDSLPQIPDWVNGPVARELDQSARNLLQEQLGSDRSLTLALAEVAESRRTEIRSLAVRCLSSLDQFDELASTFSDLKQHASWTWHFRDLQAAMVRSPETSDSIQSAFQATMGQDAVRAYRHLWGFSPEQLSNGEAAALVELLLDDSLPVRIFAFENLQRITGRRLYYQPERPKSQRQTAAIQWQKLLAEGQIAYPGEAALSTAD